MSMKFALISIWAEDVSANAHFYRDVLGLDLLPHHGSRPHFKVEGIYLTILKGNPAPAQNADPDRFPLFALSVDNLDDMLKRLAKHHIALPWGIESNAGERWVMFHDPAGNLIELVQFS
ncbi:MAG TPA: VOC family protein [Anaerolineales bacterium]|nr:VOC family protein [Anaerolineales bacterium]HLO28840.1 VOC family protein [Anaerolineales bacterium]